MAAWALALLLSADLSGEIAAAVARSRVSGKAVSIAVGRVGEAPLYTHNPEVPRSPASNQKILTAGAAIRLLGRDHRFETRFGWTADGALAVVGSGDPNFSGRFYDGDPTALLRRVARDLRTRGVTEAAGDLLLDAGRFDDQWVHPDWPEDQLDRWYCAPVAALVFNDSCWDVRVLPGAEPGSPAVVEWQPSFLRPALRRDCRTVALRGEHSVHIGRPAEGDLEVRGGILRGSTGIEGNVAVRDPVAFFGEAFRAALAAEGIAVRGSIRRGKAGELKTLVVCESPLSRTLEVMLARSQNLYAECLLKSLGEGSFASGAAAVARAVREMGIPDAGLAPVDGSGLSPANRTTVLTLYGMLQRMAEEPSFVEALAAGGSGTLERRYRELGERVRAKTGTIRGVTALSGYVTGRAGGRRVFSIVANGNLGNVRALQDALVRLLAEAP